MYARHTPRMLNWLEPANPSTGQAFDVTVGVAKGPRATPGYSGDDPQNRPGGPDPGEKDWARPSTFKLAPRNHTDKGTDDSRKPRQ